MKDITLTIVILVLLIITSCITPGEYRQVLAENDSLRTILVNFEEENDNLKTQIEEFEEKERLKTLYTDVDAYKLIEDYYDFYRADYKYRNPRVRKQSYNVFKISIEEANIKLGFWSSFVLTLTINEDGTYQVAHR